VRLDTLKNLKNLFELENKEKKKRISADAIFIVHRRHFVAEDWHEQLLVALARVKVFYGY
jgi:hypothetical protein